MRVELFTARVDHLLYATITLGLRYESRCARCRSQGRFHFVGEFGRIDQRSAPGILDHVLVVFGPQKRVDRNRNNARLDRAIVQIHEFWAVLDDHQHAFARQCTGREQSVSAAVYAFGQITVRYFLMLRDVGQTI